MDFGCDVDVGLEDIVAQSVDGDGVEDVDYYYCLGEGVESSRDIPTWDFACNMGNASEYRKILGQRTNPRERSRWKQSLR